MLWCGRQVAGCPCRCKYLSLSTVFWGNSILAPIFSIRGFFLEVKEKNLQSMCSSVFVYDSDTWALKVNNMRKLERAENSMSRN